MQYTQNMNRWTSWVSINAGSVVIITILFNNFFPQVAFAWRATVLVGRTSWKSSLAIPIRTLFIRSWVIIVIIISWSALFVANFLSRVIIRPWAIPLLPLVGSIFKVIFVVSIRIVGIRDVLITSFRSVFWGSVSIISLGGHPWRRRSFLIAPLRIIPRNWRSWVLSIFPIARIHRIIFLRCKFLLIVLIQILDIVFARFILIFLLVIYILFKESLIISRLFVNGWYFSIVRINVLYLVVVDSIELVLGFLAFACRTVDLVPGSLEVVLGVGEFLRTRVVGVGSQARILSFAKVFLFLTLFLAANLLDRLEISSAVIWLCNGHLGESFSFDLS